jgi:hypothetical protein
MKATQIRVYLVVSAIAAVITLGPRMAHAQVCVNPANTAVTATSTNVTFKVGAVTASCTSAKATFTTPAAPNNCSPPAALPICVAATVSFTGCKATIGGISVPANLTPVNPWQLCLNTAGGASTASLVIPQNGLTATATVLGQNCTTKVAPAGPTTASGGWASPTATFTNASVPVVTSGGFPCPSATTATFSGTFTSSPAITFP